MRAMQAASGAAARGTRHGIVVFAVIAFRVLGIWSRLIMPTRLVDRLLARIFGLRNRPALSAEAAA